MLNRKFLWVLGLALSLMVVFSGCAKKVTRITTDSVTDLSGKWNDTDSRITAEEMIKDALARPWYNRYSQDGKIPAIVVGKIRNKSHEHINVETFVKDIERSLINSGKADFVAGGEEREQLLEEIKSQEMHASRETQKEGLQAIGADLMMLGSINTIADSEGDESVMYYQVNLELVDIQSHRKVWIGEKKIKKLIDKDALKL